MELTTDLQKRSKDLRQEIELSEEATRVRARRRKLAQQLISYLPIPIVVLLSVFAIIDEPDKGLLSVMVGLILLVGLLVFREGDTSFRKITYWAILPIAILLLLYLSDGAMSFVKSYDYLVSLLGFLYTTLIPWLARDLRS